MGCKILTPGFSNLEFTFNLFFITPNNFGVMFFDFIKSAIFIAILKIFCNFTKVNQNVRISILKPGTEWKEYE